MSLVIKNIHSKKGINSFIRFYNELYKGNPNVAFPLAFDERSTLTDGQNPAHTICDSSYWLVYKDGRVAGRIAAIINKTEIKKSGKQIGRFGYFDFIDDFEVSKALMSAAINWLRIRKIAAVHGPFGFTDLDRQGLLVKGHNRLGTMASLYNYEYYVNHIENLGFEKSTDWVEYTFEIGSEIPSKIQRISKFVQQKYELQVLRVKSKKELKRYIPEIFCLINKTYKDLYGYTELTKEQIAYYGKNYFGFVKKEFVCLILNKNNSLVGIGLTLPSFTKALQKAKGKLLPFGWFHILKALNTNDTLDLYLVAVDNDYQGKGLNAIMIEEMHKAAFKFGIKRVETNIELESNFKVQSMWKDFDAELHKRRRCYIMNI